MMGISGLEGGWNWDMSIWGAEVEGVRGWMTKVAGEGVHKPPFLDGICVLHAFYCGGG